MRYIVGASVMSTLQLQPYLSPSASLIFPAFLWLSLPHVEASPVLSCAVACLPYPLTVSRLIWKYLEYPCSLQVTKPGLHMLDHTPFAHTWHAYAYIGRTTYNTYICTYIYIYREREREKFRRRTY